MAGSLIRDCNELLRSLHARGGGPMVRARFDDMTCASSATRALGLMRKVGTVVFAIKGQDRLWALTPLGRDHCEGRVNAFAHPAKPADPEEQRQRHERLIAGSNAAAAACDRLSPRERQVLILTAQGLMSREIARKIHVAPRSVDDIRRRMLATLNVARSTAAVVIATKAGLV